MKFLQRGYKTLLCTAGLFTLLALGPKATAQVSINIGGPPPVCAYGYYDYAPYACAPVGFYGPGYFYNGIFLGVGPWRHWGYRHGWGSRRFVSAGGGRYHPSARYHSRPGYAGRPGYTHRPGGARPGNVHAGARSNDAHRSGGARPSSARSGGGRPGGGDRPGPR